jgi:multidrug efflux system membrane fusion protein
VQYNGTAAFVYIVNANNKVSVQPVTVVTSNDNVTAVTGVSPGVSLATSGFDRLESGASVQVRGGKPTSSGSTGGSTAP